MPKILPDKSEILSRIDIDETTGCWLWTGPTDPDHHYGRIYLKVRRQDGSISRYKSHYPVHVVAWEVWNGPVPEGLELDHLCRNRRCCRPTQATIDQLLVLASSPHYSDAYPDLSPAALLSSGQHLELVTHRENVRRSNSPAGINSRKTHCPEGHEYKERAGQDGYPWRYCPECKNESRRDYYAIRQSLKSPGPAAVK